MGFCIDYAGRSVLLSGDTIPTPNILKYAHHTNPRQAGATFDKAKLKMAVYSHIVNGASPKYIGIPDDQLIERTRETYKGSLVVGEYLMGFSMTSKRVKVEVYRH